MSSLRLRLSEDASSRGLRDVFHTDLVLLHAPSVFDFREETITQGPMAAALNELMFRYGMIDAKSYAEVKTHQRAARRAIEAIEVALELLEDEKREALNKTREKVCEANADSMFSKMELEWRSSSGLRVSAALVRTLCFGFLQEAGYGIQRLVESYDSAIFSGRRTPIKQSSSPRRPSRLSVGTE